MIIRGKTAFVYDIEVFPNVFTCTVKNSESLQHKCYEISSRRNDLTEICKLFLNKRIIFVGYNNLHYDNPVIAFLLMNYQDLSGLFASEICWKIKEISDTIINSTDGKFDAWSKYKYANLFESLDLLAMMFSNKLRVGLKELQVTMQYHNVQEYEGDFDQFLPESEIDKVLEYNINDVDSTFELLNRCTKDIELRLSIEDEYGIKALSKDGVNLGMEILKQRYLAETGLTWSDIKDLRSPCDYLCLNEIIFPFINFKTKVLQDLLIDLKKQCIDPNDNSFERKFLLGNTAHTFGMGGIHSVNTPEYFEPDEDHLLIDADVASMYPSIILEHKVYPPHLGEAFLRVYGRIKDERIEAKRNKNKLKDATLKLSINGLSGNLQSPFSWVYSPKTVLQIRINGQLMLLMLAEACSEAGMHIIQSNTDGIFLLMHKDLYPKFQEICREWEKTTKLILEEDRFERFYQFAINDYLGVKEGYAKTKDPDLLKKKGLFIDKVSLGKGMAPMIIPEAINKCLADGIPIEDTIKNCKDIKRFLTYQKVAKDFTVVHGNKKLQRINRYYMSHADYYIFKQKMRNGKLSKTNMCTDSGVSILNKFDDRSIEQYKINYQYYISKAKKIVSVLKSQQLNLFW